MWLISFDIDGTLAFGNPPGVVGLEWVKQEKQRGHLIGSASDRTIADQRELWKRHGIDPDFVVLKHQLDALRSQFDAKEYLHVGDGEMDRFFAEKAGFKFLFPQEYLRHNGHGGAPPI